MNKTDNINSPNHYIHGGLETIDKIKSLTGDVGFIGYLEGNIEKYIDRYKYKGKPMEDLKKAENYLHRLMAEVGEKEIQK